MENYNISNIRSTSTDISARAIEEINGLYHKFIFSMKKTAGIAFEIGKRLSYIRENMDVTIPWQAFIRDNFDFSYNTANSYIRTFEFFKEDPAMLKDKNKSEAYALAGITSLKPEKETKEAEAIKVKYAGDDQLDLDYDIEALFNAPCISKAKLKNYRVESFHQSNRLWLINRDGGHIPVAQLYTSPPQGMPEIEQKELLKNVQIALEKYYERVEKYEEKGII